MQDREETLGNELDQQDAQAMEEVRVIHDVRPARRGTGGLILLLVLLLGLVGAGYYYFFHMASTETFSSVKAEKGNLLALGWSFEASDSNSRDIADLWEFGSKSDTYFTQVKNDAHSGMYAIRATLPETGLARARYAKSIVVNPRRQYTASAWVRVTGGAMVALKAVFRTPKNAEGDDGEAGSRILYVDEFTSGRERSMKYTKIEGPVFPPPEAGSMEFVIVAAGTGEVTIDDVALYEETSNVHAGNVHAGSVHAGDSSAGGNGGPEGELTGSQGQGQLGTSGVMDFFSCNGGYLVRRIGHTLFLGGRIVAVEAGAGNDSSLDVGLNGSGLHAEGWHDTSLEGFHPTGEGFLFGGPRAGLFRATRSLVVNAQMIQGSFTMPALVKGTLSGVRYCFDLFQGYAENGVGVLDKGEFTLYGNGFPTMQAEALIFGSEHDRIKIIFSRPIPVMGATRGEGGLSVQCLFDPSEETSFKYQVHSDFSDENREAQDLVQQAVRADQEKRYGEALRTANQIISRYPYNEAVAHRSEELRNQLLSRKKEMLSKLQRSLKSAEFLNTSDQYTRLEAACREALALFPDDKDFLQTLDRVHEMSGSLMREIREAKAASLYRIAASLSEAGGREITVREIRQYLEKRYPSSEWTRKAKALGDTPGSGNDESLDNRESGDTGSGAPKSGDPEYGSPASGGPKSGDKEEPE